MFHGAFWNNIPQTFIWNNKEGGDIWISTASVISQRIRCLKWEKVKIYFSFKNPRLRNNPRYTGKSQQYSSKWYVLRSARPAFSAFSTFDFSETNLNSPEWIEWPISLKRLLVLLSQAQRWRWSISLSPQAALPQPWCRALPRKGWGTSLYGPAPVLVCVCVGLG